MRTLRPYQREAVDFLLRVPTAGLFIDMGLGKTAATLHALLELPKPVLLIGPIRVIENVWRQEAKEWPETSGLKFSLVRGTPKEREKALEAEADIYLVNPELMEQALKARKYRTLVVEESSQFKNPSTKRFKLLRKYLKDFEHRIILTGTPSPNSLMDLWSQVYILDRGIRLGSSFYAFRNRYFYPADYMGYTYEPHAGAEEAITKAISDIIFRVEAKGVLPPREVLKNKIYVTLPPSARKKYDQMAKEAFTKLAESTVTSATAAATLMKLRQMASGIVYDDEGGASLLHNEKIKAVESILAETGSPVVLVYQFKHELAELKKAFPQGREFESSLMDDWNRGKIPLLFLHPQSGGHGLNLQHGSHTMIIYSASFSYEHMSQTMARIDRQGQEFPVVFHFLIAKDTVDELILRVLENKETVQANVLKLIKEYANDQVHNR